MKATLSIVLIVTGLLSTSAAHAQTTTFRDASGRQTGTATTSPNGSILFRDSSGRQTGTATTDSNGTITFRDDSGRMTGTAEAPVTCAIAQRCLYPDGKWK